MKDEIRKELEELSPLLFERLKDKYYSIDSEYFSGLEDKISSKLGFAEKKDVRTTYFDNLQSNVVNEAIKPKKIFRIHPMRWAIAASLVICLFSLAWFLRAPSSENTVAQNTLDEMEILEFYSDEMSDEELAYLIEYDDESEDFDLSDISDDQLEEALYQLIDSEEELETLF